MYVCMYVHIHTAVQEYLHTYINAYIHTTEHTDLYTLNKRKQVAIPLPHHQGPCFVYKHVRVASFGLYVR
jgi:hypothetical protein